MAFVCLFVSMSKGSIVNYIEIVKKTKKTKRGKLLQTSSIFIVKKTAQVNINSINKKKVSRFKYTVFTFQDNTVFPYTVQSLRIYSIVSFIL